MIDPKTEEEDERPGPDPSNSTPEGWTAELEPEVVDEVKRRLGVTDGDSSSGDRS